LNSVGPPLNQICQLRKIFECTDPYRERSIPVELH
jgi:hypothetical protein